MNTLQAEKRDMSVKAKRLRRQGLVTGNIFGRDMESMALTMTRKDVDQLLKHDQKGSQIMLKVDGKSYNALIKEVQYNTIEKRYDEVDFQALVSNEKVHTTAEIIFENHDKILSGVFQEDLTEVQYRAYPSALVSKVKVDVGNMKIGDVIRVKDLDIAKNKDIDLHTDLEAIVASVFASRNDVKAEETETAAEEK